MLLTGTALAPLHAQQAAPPATEQAPAQPGAAAPPAAAPAEAPPAWTPPPKGEREITVTGKRPRGSVVGDIPPEITMSPLEIRALGASTLNELLQTLEPQTRSDRGRENSQPVVLLNGKRVSSRREVDSIPPEAIERMEIFPEEVALKYGYRADQRVVNVVTFERFRSKIGEAGYGFATAGGRDNYRVGGNYLRIDGETRWSFDAEYQHSGALYESERNLLRTGQGAPFDLAGNIGPFSSAAGAQIDPALSALAGTPVTIAGVPAGAASGRPSLADFRPGANLANETDTGGFRTLLPASDRISLNGTVSRNILGDVSASLTAAYLRNDSDSRLGLAPASLVLPAGNPFSPFSSDVRLYRFLNPADPLGRETDSQAAHLGISLTGALSKWIWSFTGNYDRATATGFTDTGADVPALQARLNAGDTTANPFADQSFTLRERDEARSTNSSADAQLVLSGALFKMPAGEVSASLRGSAETRDFSSESRRGGVEQSQDLSRDRGTVQANLDVPLARRGTGGISGIGNLSINFNAEAEQLSDFGTLRTFGYGLTWTPVKQLNLIASFTDEDGAPTVQQLGDPFVVTPNARVFDFVRGETVEVSRITGGNPDLRADNRNVFKLGLSARPFEKKDLSFNFTYTRSRTKDTIAAFPPATAEIEAAFPDRFSRDAEGRLTRIDSRPINFARHDQEDLRWGVTYSRPLGKGPPGNFNIRFAPAGGPPPDLPPGATQVRISPDSARGRQIEGMLSRLIFGFQHTWRLQDEILIRPEGPELDLLSGSALNSRGGQPRHELEAQAAAFHRGLGARLTASWRSGTTVEGFGSGARAGAGDLTFSSLATVNLNLFVDLGQRLGVAKYPWLRGARLSIGVNNLLDSRQEVRDSAGKTPFSYQPAFLDPLGRSVNISLRKTFF
jgi:hypothetical protein